MKDEVIIRKASVDDAEKILKVYAPYVTDTAISFEYDVPTVEEFAKRIENTLKKYPYFVAEKNGEILGYVYASPFSSRIAYSWSVETSIYLAKESRGQGVGRKLYEALEDALYKMGIISVNACIAVVGHLGEDNDDMEDPYLTNLSEEFHTHMGYRLVGRFYKSGYKLGRWYDMIWMEKLIRKHPEHPDMITPFSELVD